jgi:hypothetical protein
MEMWDAPVDKRHYRLVAVFYKLFMDRRPKNPIVRDD